MAESELKMEGMLTVEETKIKSLSRYEDETKPMKEYIQDFSDTRQAF